ncbi:HAD family hydrolase [Candidatus Woesearchaeota archaeon]|nr:MAG: HAD family hydrolase [Candidatus Woesearchaeota archaeon]
MIKVVIFDFDNTIEQWIVPEAEVDIVMSEKIAKKYGLHPTLFRSAYNDVKNKLRGGKYPSVHDRYNWYRGALAQFKIIAEDKQLTAWTEEYWKEITKRVSLFPGVSELLSELRKKYKLAILTDSDGKKEYKMMRIKKLKVDKMVDGVFTTDDTGFNKPDPRIYQLIMKTFNVKPDECIMVGDDPSSDLLGAKRLGMKTIWTKQSIHVSSHHAFIDYEITDIKEVAKILNEKALK